MDQVISARAGFAAALEVAELVLRLGPGILMEKRVERRLPQVAEVLFDGPATSDDVIYFMNYDIRPEGRAETATVRPIRYDVTVILPRRHGSEYNKTAGHYHPAAVGQALSYPEVYEVIAGRALYVLQRLDATGAVADVILVEAGPGDQVLIPPEYGHVSINPGDEPLVMANLVARDCQPDYGPIRAKQGACYYRVATGIVANPHYGEVPEPRPVALKNLAPFGLGAEKPLFTRFAESPERFRYLYEPDAARLLFEQALGRCFQG
jgi:glucose-6-phosphate isomerase, archaeal